MTVICRTCLQEFNENSVTFFLNSTDSKSATITVGCKLAYCIPEMDLDVVPNAVICNRCFESLTVAHEFKAKCLETEGRIQSYIEQMGYILTCINLKDIAQQKSKPQYDSFASFSQPYSDIAVASSRDVYNSVRNSPKETSLDIKNLQCDSKNFFAVPKIAQLLASPENSFKCNQCNYTTAKIDELKTHEKSHFSQELHKCSECEYSAPKRQTLIIHMRKHAENENPFKCELCDYKGRLKYDLQTHMRLHNRDKPYKCLLCDYSSSHKTNLNHHMRLHSGEKSYKCKPCTYKTSAKSNIKTHKCKSINHIKSYTCTVCNYNSSSKINFIKHTVGHTGEKTFQCYNNDHKNKTQNCLEKRRDINSTKTDQNCINDGLQRHIKRHESSGSDISTAVKNEMII